ncbi:curved DNA-binding protein CbpA [Prauserella isguenensis]|uniref:Curved DNA-binding protein CbpA n=1 Tax=Prauserella isguenensis TaxID=1470180 RepID=A0A839S5K4_9PSEU|nr:J domain-containing protein [Prauserella isguenensis]MBB3053046.1 curved DNA-binding protein CbpA [Prauserella isguenensis]
MGGDRRDDPCAVLGVPACADLRETTAAYRRRVRQLHPDTASGDDTADADGATGRPSAAGGDADQLAAVVAAYELLRARRRRAASDPRRSRCGEDERARPSAGDAESGTPIPVRVHNGPRSRTPDLRAGPVRRHPD